MTVEPNRTTAESQPLSPSRRAFVGGAAGLAGILATGRPPAGWAAREISVLTAVHYAPASDVKLAELGKRFAKASGVGVRFDHMQSVQMSGKLSAELMSKGGHDIVSLEMHYPYLSLVSRTCRTSVTTSRRSTASGIRSPRSTRS